MKPLHLLILSIALLLVSVAGCDEPDPILQALSEEDRGVVEKIGKENAKKADGTAEPEAVGYRKPANVYVDVHWLGGRKYTDHLPEVTDQLGAVLGREELGPSVGAEIKLERGLIRVIRDRIYMLRVPLPQPMTRAEALEILGFPPFVGNWRQTDKEFRLGHEWDFSRFRFFRWDQNPDRVVEVEAWKEKPEKIGR